MIIVLKPLSNQSTIDRLTRRLEELGMKPHVIVGVERTVIAATGKEQEGTQAELEGDTDVEKVLPILAETRKEPTVVQTGSLTIGGGTIGVIAGPCSVEGEAEILEIARLVKAAGATALRGGAFKPRTSPYAFQGMKERGLELLSERSRRRREDLCGQRLVRRP